MWPAAVGLVEHANRQHRPICVEEPAFAFIFTKTMICHRTVVDPGRARIVLLQAPAIAPPDWGEHGLCGSGARGVRSPLRNAVRGRVNCSRARSVAE